MRPTGSPTAAGYAEEWKRLKTVGEASKGLRWYSLSATGKKSFPMNRRPEGKHPYVLCKLDDCNVTGASLSSVSAQRDVGSIGEDWVVVFDVREEHRASMRRLTAEEGTFLAIIMDGEVDSAPVLQSSLSDSGRISGGFTETKAKALANLLGTEPLPVRFKLAGDKR